LATTNLTNKANRSAMTGSLIALLNDRSQQYQAGNDEHVIQQQCRDAAEGRRPDGWPSPSTMSET